MSPGPAPSPSAAPALSPVPGPISTPSGVRPPASPGPSTRGSTTSERPKASSQEIGQVGVGGGGEVAGAGGVAAVGDEVVEGAGTAQLPGEPVVREAHGGRARGVLRLVGREPAQLGGGDRRDRQRARRVRPRLRAQLGHQVGGRLRRAGVVPQQRGPHDLAVGVEAHHAVLLARHRDRCRRPRGRPPARDAACNASHQPAGSTSVPGGCGARPDRTCSPVVASRMTMVQDCVDESTPATRLMNVTLVPRPGGSACESADPAVRRQGAARSSYRAYSDRAATPPAGGWAVESRGEPSGPRH